MVSCHKPKTEQVHENQRYTDSPNQCAAAGHQTYGTAPRTVERSRRSREPDVALPTIQTPSFKLDAEVGSGLRQVTAEDGTFGIGETSFGTPVAAIIDEHFAPMLIGENCFAVEKIWDMMFRMSKPYGSQGLTSCAMSGIDIALWDLNGKIKNQPVYELLGDRCVRRCSLTQRVTIPIGN